MGLITRNGVSARVVVLAASLLSVSAFGQGTSVLTGTVTDASTNQPVGDVVITATSPSMQGEQIVVTDATGLYRLPNLPPGTYTIRAEKEAYKPYARGDISIRIDRTIRVNVIMMPEALKAEEVVVTGRAPTVDVGSTTTGVSVGKDFIANIAVARAGGAGIRSYESLAAVAPQVTGDAYGFGISGTSSPENLILVDGLSVTDPAYGINGSPFPLEFVEETNVITGGYMAEYGRATGGVLNVTTKSGSNEFHGSVWGSWTPGVLEGQSKEIRRTDVMFVSNGQLWNAGDVGVELGGPIMKDKLWFYVGFSPSFSRARATRSLQRFLVKTATNSAGTANVGCAPGFVDPATNAPCRVVDYERDEFKNPKYEDLPGTLKTRFDDSRAYSYIGKLTYLINADQNVSLSVVGSPKSAVSPFSFYNRAAGTRTTDDNNDLSLKYQAGFLDKRLLVDVTAGWHHQQGGGYPTDGSKIGSDTGAAGTPVVIYRRTNRHSILDFEELPAEAKALCEANFAVKGTGATAATARNAWACPGNSSGIQYAIGGAGYMDESVLDRYQGKMTVTYLANLLGHHVFKAGLDAERISYSVHKAYSGGFILREATNGNTFLDYRQYGYFTGPDEFERLNEVRTVSNSNLVGGFVQDSWSVADLFTLNAGLRYETQQLFAYDGTLGMTLNNMLAPRVGVIYDFTQQGRSKLYANYAQYYESVPLDIADRSLSGEYQGGFVRFRTAVPNGRPGCDPLADINQAKTECQDKRNQVHLDSATPNQSGIVTGGGKTAVDSNLKPQSTDEIVVGGDYEVIPDGRAGISYTKRRMLNVIEDMSRDEANTYFIGNPGYGIATDFPKAVRDYDAVTVSFTKAFSDLWQAQASYTYSSLRGNYNGLFRPENGQLDPNINSDFDLISLLANKTGPLDADRTHVVKAFASKSFAIGGAAEFSLGLNYTGQSGRPINYLASHAIYGPTESYVLPRGSGGRLPWLHAVDGKLGVTWKASKDMRVTFTTDVFNMFNFQGVTGVDQTFSIGEMLPTTIPPGKTPQEAICIAGTDPNCQSALKKSGASGPVDATADDINLNYKRVTAYQTPRQVRFGVKVSF